VEPEPVLLEEKTPEIPEIVQFDIPDTMEKINQLRELLRNYPGDVKVIIGGKDYMVNPD
jgi:hypothetical protein